MKVFFVGVLSVTLLGCACPTAPQAMLETCTSKPCFYRTAASPPIELKPTPFKPNSTTTKVKPKTATKTAKKSSASAEAAKPNSPRTSNDSHKGKIASATPMTPDSSAPPPQSEEGAKTTVGMSVNVAVSGQTPEASDPVLEKAKAAVARKMGDTASVEFEDMTRAIRKDPFGQTIDTVCGQVRGKKTSGAGTGKRAFLYLVKDGIALVEYGPVSLQATAYRNVCTTGELEPAIGR